jgi:hypothetical protein
MNEMSQFAELDTALLGKIASYLGNLLLSLAAELPTAMYYPLACTHMAEYHG